MHQGCTEADRVHGGPGQIHFEAWRTGALLTVKFRQPSHEFTFGVDMSFILYPLVLTPLI
jgi:hypothetical protein